MSYNRNKLIGYAMEAALLFCLLLIAGFFVSTLSFSSPILMPVWLWLVCLGFPYMLWVMMRIYRDRHHQGVIDFPTAWVLGIYIIFFASLPEGLVKYIYFHYLNPDYIATQMTQIADLFAKLARETQDPSVVEFSRMYAESAVPSSIQMVFQGIFNNLFFGAFGSAIAALCARRLKPKRLFSR
jgi:hypothetical protein